MLVPMKRFAIEVFVGDVEGGVLFGGASIKFVVDSGCLLR